MGNSFGNWVKRRRKALDLTQQELARRVGCSVATIVKIEADERRPSRQITELLARQLEISPDQKELFLKVARQEKAVDRLDSLAPPSLLPQQPDPSTLLKASLPIPLTPLLGREHELRILLQQLQNPACRLLTLTGLGGVGKTRLALEAARQARDSFEHGAWFVSLVGASSSESIAPTIASALGFSFSGTTGLKAQLFNYLREKQILLVLDNLEHLLEGIELLDELLEFAPNVRILTTSREHLNLRSEWVFEIQGLPVPSNVEAANLEANSAVALFLQRAKQVNLRFAAAPEDLHAVARICQLVEGLPLGLELAAAWVRIMSVSQIAQEIEGSLDFLTSSLRDLPHRHRSIRAVIDHSWELLPDAERQVLRQLSVFHRGFTREAAQQVTGASTRLLVGLVNKSLLVRQPVKERYELHELLRQYAEEQLQSDGSARASVHRAHAAYYADLMQRSWSAFRSPKQVDALATMEQDIENIHTAWRYHLADGNSMELLKFMDSFWMFYDIRGWNQSAVALFEEAAEGLRSALGDGAATLAHGKALGYAGFFNGIIGDPKRGLALSQEALALIRPLDQPESLGYALFGAALNCVYIGDYQQLNELTQAMSRISQELNDKWMEGFSLNFLTTILADQQHFQEAREAIDRALQIFGQEICEYLGLAWANLVRGRLALSQGAYAEARLYYERGLKAAQTLNYRRTTQQSYDDLGDVALYLNEVEQAEFCFRRSLEVSRETGQTREMLGALYDLARVSAAQGNKAKAVGLLAVVLQHPLSSLPLFLRTEPIILREAAERFRARLQSELEPEVYQVAWVDGRARSLDGVVSELLQ